MTNRIIQINKISKLNSKSLSQNDSFSTIQYLDTSNITKNKILELQTLDVKKEKIPSRAKRKIERNTIIYSTVRPNQEHYGFFETPQDNLIVSTGFTTIDVIDKNIDPKYLYYLITQKTITDFLQNIGVNAVSSYPSIKPGDLGNLKFQIPESFQEQQKIAAALSALDAKIVLNNKINAELEAMAKTLYDYWFVQFDFPDKNGKPYKSNGGKMVYNEKLKREIPFGWSTFSIKELLGTSKNGDWGADEQSDDLMKVYCIRGADINALNGKTGNLEPPVRYIDINHKDRLLKLDDLIVEISGGSPTQSTGRIAHIGQTLFSRFETPIVCSNFCKAISMKKTEHSCLIKQYWNKLYEARIFFNFEGKTSGIKNLLFDQLIKDVYIALPDNDQLIQTYYAFSSRNDELMQNNLGENNKLSDLRDWLLPMLMNGQVTVN